MRKRIYSLPIILLLGVHLSCSKINDESRIIQPEIAEYSPLSSLSQDTTETEGHHYVRLKNGLVLEKKDSLYYLEEDMRYNASQLAMLGEMSTEKFNPRSESVSSFPTYWKRRIVPYEFDSSCSSTFQYYANVAMTSISSVSGVRFVAATSQTDKIVFHYSSSQNDSSVGEIGGSQTINIHDYTDTGTFVHEILHALGFYHEHSRDDRDDYLIVKWSNIKLSKRHNFYKHSTGLCTTVLDTTSIMIYGSKTSDASFVYNVNEPMLTGLLGELFSWHNSLSALDIQDIKNIYGPPYHKMDIERETIYEYYEYGTEIIETESTYRIKFYSNESCTIPTSLPNNRSVIIRETNTYCDVFQQIHTESIDYVVTIPSGYSSYLIGTHNDYEYYAYGSPSNIDIVSYEIVNSH